jgi:hypothetical protein
MITNRLSGAGNNFSIATALATIQILKTAKRKVRLPRSVDSSAIACISNLPKYAPRPIQSSTSGGICTGTITPNHPCRTIGELLREGHDWSNAQENYYRQSLAFRATYKLAGWR